MPKGLHLRSRAKWTRTTPAVETPCSKCLFISCHPSFLLHWRQINGIPLKCNTQSVENDRLASDLAALGYPGFSYLTACSKRNPVEVVLSALQVANLESRLAEALPWVLLQYPDLDWKWLVSQAKANELQNKLGFLTNDPSCANIKRARVESSS